VAFADFFEAFFMEFDAFLAAGEGEVAGWDGVAVVAASVGVF
jgi:hypothetical protein